ncbi:hypothetical protein DESC_820027 [Desulfosarcina cetonica]|nr:hypothetical protein DESC_820027 [Desulfosarcina cetonica]
MFLARPKGGSCINNTATTDNAAPKYYLEHYSWRFDASVPAHLSSIIANECGRPPQYIEKHGTR